MNNEQIIAEAAAEIWGIDAVQEMIINGQDVPLHTVQGWKTRGNYYVKKGEHGLQVRLWKRKKGNKASEEDQEEINEGNFYLTKAYLFREDQMIQVD